MDQNDWMRSISRGALVLCVAVSSMLGGCDTQGCAADCLAESLSDCSSGCGCSECACEGCTILPVPGGFPSGVPPQEDLRIPNATQIRLTPEGLDYLEQGVDAVAQANPVPFPSTRVVATGFGYEMLICATGVVDFSAPATGAGAAACFVPPFCGEIGGLTTTRSFTARGSGAALAVVDSPVGTTCNTALAVVDESNGNSLECRVSYLAPGSRICRFDVTEGHRYEVRVFRQGCGIGAARAYAFAPAPQGCALHTEFVHPPGLFPEENFLRANAEIAVHSVNRAGADASMPTIVYQSVLGGTVGVQQCTIDYDTRRSEPETIITSIQAGISPSEDRPGFGRTALGEFFIERGDIQSIDVSSDCNFFGLSIPTVLSFVTGVTGDPATTLTQAVDIAREDISRICQPAFRNPTTGERDICPGGSAVNVRVDEDDVTHYECFPFDDFNGDGIKQEREDFGPECVSQLLGAEVRLDLSELLSAITPSLRAGVDILFALSDDAQEAAGGYTVPVYGGFQSAGTSTCSTDLTEAQREELGLTGPPMDVALAQSFLGGEDTHHLQIGLSERVMNWGAYQLWRSGALCVEATTRLDPLLSTGLFSLLVPSLRDLTFPASKAALGISLRPQLPPFVDLGEGTEEDPLLQFVFPQLAIDFYVWSNERYVRFMTFQGDVRVMAALDVDEAGMITPAIRDIRVENEEVLNAELVRESPEVLGTAVSSALRVASGMLGGAIPGFDLSSALNGGPLPLSFAPATPETFRLVEDAAADGGTERFLGVFLDLAPAVAPVVQTVDTELAVVALQVRSAEEMAIDRFVADGRARLEVELSGHGPDGVEIEYQVRVDGGMWGPWTRSRYAVIEAESLALQGHHDVEGRARVVGVAGSVDRTPARSEFIIDVLAPDVELAEGDASVELHAADAVTEGTDLEYRVASDDGSFGPWQAAAGARTPLPGLSADAIVEVRDEAGNVASVSHALRGLPPPAADDDAGCGCSSVPSSSGGPLVVLIFALLACTTRKRGRERTQ